MKKKYEVVFVKSIYLPVYVNASSEDEAEDIANEILDEIFPTARILITSRKLVASWF